ncbi:glycosyltransferase [Polaribacter sp. WD7]|uniref:glycosyltransferase n=1 Tax=Polaribacter sp. WD7 TaxID=2269061 RepID=UPI0015F04683|nr:glycosyltransferase [Polaribacter sp. WD7]
MKILHIVEDFSIDSGGLRTVVNDLNNNLNKAGFFSFILSSKKEKQDSIYRVESSNTWLFSTNWSKKLSSLKDSIGIDIVHIHGVWMYPQFIAAKFCIKNKIPFLLSCHGMYEPWLWDKGKIKKKIYFDYLIKNKFNKASYIHAITPQEKENLTTLFPSNNIVEIPNLINNITISKKNKNSDHKEKYILYLGRLDEKKGIDLLLNAYSRLKNNNISIKIAGRFNNYKNYLETLVESLNLNDNVEFLGVISGKQKQDVIENALVLTAPSHSEVIGMVNLEAGILKTPVITTYQTGLHRDWNIQGGKLINPNVNELEKILKEVLSWSSEERKKNGEKLSNFIKENYSWEKRFKDWESLYNTIIYETAK